MRKLQEGLKLNLLKIKLKLQILLKPKNNISTSKIVSELYSNNENQEFKNKLLVQK